MANRVRVDKEKLAEANAVLTGLLQEHGGVSTDTVRLTASFLNRSERTVWRYVSQLSGELGIEPRRDEPSSSDQSEHAGLDALLHGAPFSFGEADLKRAALAYAGNRSALHRDATALAGRLDLPGPVSYPQLAPEVPRGVARR